MSKEMTNFQTDAALKNINDENLSDNFVAVFPANEMKDLLTVN